MRGATSSASARCSTKWSRARGHSLATSTADTLNAVMRAQPKPPSAIVPAVPSDLEKVIVRCLRKDPDRRFQHMGDVKVALQEIKEDSESARATGAASPRRHTARRVTITASLILAVGAGTGWLLWRLPRSSSPPRLMSLTTLAGAEDWPTFSPDGEQIAFEWTGERNDNSDIYITIVGSSETRRLTTHPATDYAPSWSPDGRRIAFLARRGRRRPDLCRVSAWGRRCQTERFSGVFVDLYHRVLSAHVDTG